MRKQSKIQGTACMGLKVSFKYRSQFHLSWIGLQQDKHQPAGLGIYPGVLFGNVNYNYQHKYYLSGILRRDGSSRFSAGNKWGTFFSVSGGWNVESEEFMYNLQEIHKLKLRVGYGSIGNQNIPLYAYTDRYGYNYYYTFGGDSYNGYALTQLGNFDLKWETSNQFNAVLIWNL